MRIDPESGLPAVPLGWCWECQTDGPASKVDGVWVCDECRHPAVVQEPAPPMPGRKKPGGHKTRGKSKGEGWWYVGDG